MRVIEVQSGYGDILKRICRVLSTALLRTLCNALHLVDTLLNFLLSLSDFPLEDVFLILIVQIYAHVHLLLEKFQDLLSCAFLELLFADSSRFQVTLDPHDEFIVQINLHAAIKRRPCEPRYLVLGHGPHFRQNRLSFLWLLLLLLLNLLSLLLCLVGI